MWTCEILSAPRSDLAKQKQSDQMSETKNLELEHRLLIVKLHSEGIDIPKIAELFNRNEYTVKNYISMYKKGGIEALRPSRQTGHISGFAICAKNDDYPVSLEIGKIYQIIFDAQDIKYNLIRIIDETGEDYYILKNILFLLVYHWMPRRNLL